MTWNSPIRYFDPKTGIAYGHYAIAVTSGLITSTGVTANSSLFSAIWAPPLSQQNVFPQCVITRLTVIGTTITAFGSALELGWGAFIARAVTGKCSGGTAVTLSGDNNQVRTIMGTSLFTSTNSDMRIASTAGLTTSGVTRTLDANPFAVSGSYLSTSNPTALAYKASLADGEHPITLNSGEGIDIQNLIAFTATGTVRLAVAMSWVEVGSF
jgi:hypothetical protein